MDKSVNEILEASFSLGAWSYVAVYSAVEVAKGRTDTKRIQDEANKEYWRLKKLRGLKNGKR